MTTTKSTRYQVLLERLEKDIKQQVMRPLRSPVDYHDWYVSFLENVREGFSDLGLTEFIKTGKWPKYLNLLPGMSTSTNPVQPILKFEMEHLHTCVYRYIKAYLKQSVYDPNIKAYIDDITDPDQVDEFRIYPRKLLEATKGRYNMNPMRTIYAAYNSMHPLRRINNNSSFGDDYLRRLKRNTKAIENALDDAYPVKDIEDVKLLTETWKKRQTLLLKSYACFIINSPNTYKLFDNNSKRLEEPCYEMFNTTDDYHTAIANDKTQAVNGTVGNIAYRLSAEQDRERIKRISQRKTPGSGINTNYKSRYEPNKTTAKRDYTQCKKCGKNYPVGTEHPAHDCPEDKPNRVHLITNPIVLKTSVDQTQVNDTDQQKQNVNLIKLPAPGNGMNFPVNPFILDSGSPIHICSDLHLFKTFERTRTSYSSLEEGSTHYCEGIGSVDIILGQPGTGTIKVTLKDVYYAPDASYNIISLYKLQESQRMDILYTNRHLRFVLAEATRTSPAYKKQTFQRESVYGIVGKRVYKLGDKSRNNHTILYFQFDYFYPRPELEQEINSGRNEVIDDGFIDDD